MDHIHAIRTDKTYLIEPLLYAATGGDAKEMTASISNFDLTTGVSILLKITTTNTAAPSLSINDEEPVSIFYNNAALAGNMLKQNYIYSLTYDGQHWVVNGDITPKNITVSNHSLIFSEN